MPLIHANLLAGRSRQQKADFAKAVTEAATAHLGVPAAAVRVIFHEIDPHDWFTAGESKAASSPPR